MGWRVRSRVHNPLGKFVKFPIKKIPCLPWSLINIFLIIVFQFPKFLQRTGYLEFLLLLWVMIVKLLAEMLKSFWDFWLKKQILAGANVSVFKQVGYF